jgi:NAD(P)-dependent dehydrogenase (short-subunit alcohol dehydrogenase family)
MPGTRTADGLTVAVTGGANGIGLAVARAFAGAGAKVAIGDVDQTAATAAAEALGDRALAMPLDVSDRDAFAAFLDAAEARHGPLDVLVNNAGIDWVGPFHEEPDAVTRREVDVNLMGTIIGTRLALQRMLPRDKGHIVNVASGVGRLPLPGSASYSATKHAIVGLTESLRLEYRATGVRFSLIQPSQVETAMIDGQARPRLMAQIPPGEVAAAVLDAVRRDRFEVWVPRSQAAGVKVAALLPRRLREAALLAMGIARLTAGTDRERRRDYHDRMFGR